MTSSNEILSKLQASLLESSEFGRERISIGPYTGLIHPSDALIYLNYAVPTSEPEEEALPLLIHAFRSRSRRPRFEYFTDLWPGLEEMLVRNGFVVESRTPVMTITRNELTPGPSNAESLESIGLLESFYECASEAFEQQMTDMAASSLAGIQEGRLIAAGIVDEGSVVSGGFVVGAGPIAEVAGVATRRSHRRRGLASQVSRSMCQRFFDRGGEIAWLSAGSDAARAVYAGIGFREVGEQLNISMPD